MTDKFYPVIRVSLISSKSFLASLTESIHPASSNPRLPVSTVRIHPARIRDATARRVRFHQRSPIVQDLQLEVCAVPTDEVPWPGHHQNHRWQADDEDHQREAHPRSGRVPGGDVMRWGTGEEWRQQLRCGLAIVRTKMFFYELFLLA